MTFESHISTIALTKGLISQRYVMTTRNGEPKTDAQCTKQAYTSSQVMHQNDTTKYDLCTPWYNGCSHTHLKRVMVRWIYGGQDARYISFGIYIKLDGRGQSGA
uniref:Uncharacterized protein n=1 Tax=Opuntia streptacantha TaxID=393608 RepID=A0A7C9EQC7_OPUST